MDRLAQEAVAATGDIVKKYQAKLAEFDRWSRTVRENDKTGAAA